MSKNTLLTNILSALAVAVIVFTLLDLTFLFFAAITWLLEKVVIPGSIPSQRPWFMPISFVVAAAIIELIPWLVFRSKTPTLGKAIFMTVPVAVILVLIGIALSSWPVLPYLVSGLLIIGLLFYFSRTKQPWLYF